MSHKAAEKPKLRRTPHEEVGPMYPVIKPVDRGYDLTVNPKTGERAAGQILYLSGRVLDTDGNAIVGARVAYVLTHASDYSSILDVFKVWQGGISLLGGFFGAILFGLPVMYRRRRSFWKVMDAAAPGMALGVVIGRIGDLIVADHQHVSGAALLDRYVDHPVVARLGQHGDGGAGDRRAGPDRPHVWLHQPDTSGGLVDGRNAERAEIVDQGIIDPGNLAHHDGFHASSSRTIGNRR